MRVEEKDSLDCCFASNRKIVAAVVYLLLPSLARIVGAARRLTNFVER